VASPYSSVESAVHAAQCMLHVMAINNVVQVIRVKAKEVAIINTALTQIDALVKRLTTKN
jgi:hypothetical protein